MNKTKTLREYDFQLNNRIQNGEDEYHKLINGIQESVREKESENDSSSLFRWMKITFFVVLGVYIFIIFLRYGLERLTKRDQVDTVKNRVLYLGLFENSCMNYLDLDLKYQLKNTHSFSKLFCETIDSFPTFHHWRVNHFKNNSIDFSNYKSAFDLPLYNFEKPSLQLSCDFYEFFIHSLNRSMIQEVLQIYLKDHFVFHLENFEYSRSTYKNNLSLRYCFEMEDFKMNPTKRSESWRAFWRPYYCYNHNINYINIDFESINHPKCQQDELLSLFESILNSISFSSLYAIHSQNLWNKLKKIGKNCKKRLFFQESEWISNIITKKFKMEYKNLENISVSNIELLVPKESIYGIPYITSIHKLQEKSNLKGAHFNCISQFCGLSFPKVCLLNGLHEESLQTLFTTYSNIIKDTNSSQLHLHIHSPSVFQKASEYYFFLHKQIFQNISSISLEPQDLYHLYHYLRRYDLEQKRNDGYISYNWPTLSKSLLSSETPSVDLVTIAITFLLLHHDLIKRIHFISKGYHLLVQRDNYPIFSKETMKHAISLSSLSSLLSSFNSIDTSEPIIPHFKTGFDILDFTVTLKKRERNIRSQFQADKYKIPKLFPVREVTIEKNVLSWNQDEGNLQFFLSPILINAIPNNFNDAQTTVIQTLIASLEFESILNKTV